MLIFKTKKALTAHISELKSEGKRIGLVPTMGALHRGHLSLLDFIKGHCDIRVCSIFVNPTQFNNPEDLERYPRPVERDIEVLKEAACDILFLPEVEEMYAEGESWSIDLGNLDSILEGAFRGGHFQGVTQIVHKLFSLVRPDVACFGQKDYQQFAVIQKMVTDLNLPVSLVLCPIIREADGLAMSSRNVRLGADGREHALALYNALAYFRKHARSDRFRQVKQDVVNRLKADTAIGFEYFEVCDPADLSPLETVQPAATVVALVAAWVDGVRLIDNMLIDIAK